MQKLQVWIEEEEPERLRESAQEEGVKVAEFVRRTLRRERVFQMRLTAEEDDALRSRAKVRGVSMSAYVRAAALDGMEPRRPPGKSTAP